MVLDNYEKKHGKENDERVITINNPMHTKHKTVIKNPDLSLNTRIKASLLEKIIHQL